jgi:hypothetical protein
VELVELGGNRRVHGLNRLTEGATGQTDKETALTRARDAGFAGAGVDEG